MWTKISSLEITIFYLNMMVKNEIDPAPSEIPANLPGQFNLSWLTFLHWAAATLSGQGEYQNKTF